ncbi:MAG: hypothetical protein CR954_00295 [Candidatus Moraniibacteriota bacterium]|nr:MAG: hypothetical protein CR954_00295 [Candidatus Moranbacteria bacterium]
MQQNIKSKTKKRGLYIVLAFALFIGAPVLSAILVQNFTQWNMTVDEPPVRKIQGADANYDGDNDDTTGYLQVNIGGTIANGDAGDGLGTDTNLSHEEITFSCFTGDRTYYTDVIQLQNTTTTDWNVALTVEDDLQGNPGTEDSFTTTGTADIWMYASNANSIPAVATYPNPTAAVLAPEWNPDFIQLEVLNGDLQVADDAVAAFTIPGGEQRQVALVVDCSDDMAGDTGTGTFRMTVASSPQ